MNNALTARLRTMSIDELVDIITRLNSDYRDEAGLVLDAALVMLESKMCPADFVRFCEKLSP